ncbi:L-seryl-tRNA(Sec) kinase [Uranotaenia lowii]|uniref:L-seryl-tRNA(Sec) kinase n=1 Tax=Uranotaenia lowii TaxID=190385 RepID=UPI00247940FC|nr:L-seryl-tRNA(Sec) kinase [Uranotaenia lowii]
MRKLLTKPTMKQICLNVLIGLPGAGKTTFCREVTKYLESKHSSLSVIHVCFDDYIKVNSQIELESGSFKEQRNQLLLSLDRLLEFIVKKDSSCNSRNASRMLDSEFQTVIAKLNADSKTCFLILLDDNMYYRSMRFSVYQLSRKYQTGYMQMFFEVPLEVAQRQNAQREEPIPDQVLVRMESKLQKPLVDFCHWERNSFHYKEQPFDFTSIEECVFERLEHPERSLEEVPDRKPMEQSAVHKIDLRLRKTVGKLIKNQSGTGGVDNRNLSIELNRKRKSLLDDMRNRLLEIDDNITDEELQKLFCC